MASMLPILKEITSGVFLCKVRAICTMLTLNRGLEVEKNTFRS